MQELETLAHAAATYQKNPREIEAFLPAVGVKLPELVLNGRRYFKVADLIEAVGHLARHDVEQQRESAEKNNE